jgi:hypothetical protein
MDYGLLMSGQKSFMAETNQVSVPCLALERTLVRFHSTVFSNAACRAVQLSKEQILHCFGGRQ